MALSIFEKQAIKEFAEQYKKEVQKAIYKKKVSRVRTLLPTRFSTPVNSSGSLAKSIKYKIKSDGELRFSSNDYLYFLIYGRKPQPSKIIRRSKGDSGGGGKSEFVSSIEQWMRQKGIRDVSPFAIINSINKNGSSIYRKYKGQQSNLLNDVPVDKLLNELYSKMGEAYIQKVEFSILDFINVEDLNIEL